MQCNNLILDINSIFKSYLDCTWSVEQIDDISEFEDIFGEEYKNYLNKNKKTIWLKIQEIIENEVDNAENTSTLDSLMYSVTKIGKKFNKNLSFIVKQIDSKIADMESEEEEINLSHPLDNDSIEEDIDLESLFNVEMFSKK